MLVFDHVSSQEDIKSDEQNQTEIDCVSAPHLSEICLMKSTRTEGSLGKYPHLELIRKIFQQLLSIVDSVHSEA